MHQNSEKWPFQNFNVVLYQTGRPFFGKILKNRFFSIHIHKTELHLPVEKNQRNFFLTVTIASHGPLTGLWYLIHFARNKK